MEIILKTILGIMSSFFGFYYIRDIIKNRKKFSDKPWSALLGIGFFTQILDTLGIGCFAIQTAILKFFKLIDDRLMPGTLNVGNTTSTVFQALIFMTAFDVEPLTLVSMSTSAPLGALIGAGFVVKMSRRKIQIGLGAGLMLVAIVIIAGLK